MCTCLPHLVGRKSGKGCYVYGKGKEKSVNQEAEKIMEKYHLPIQGRSVCSKTFIRKVGV